MEDRYRRLSFITDMGGIKSALGEMWGLFFPRQPVLNRDKSSEKKGRTFDESWFVGKITQKVLYHPEGALEYPFFGERIYGEPIVGFVRGDDPIFERFKEVVGPHHFTPWEIMAWQARKNGVDPPPPEELSVVAFVLPLNPATIRDNASQTDWVAQRWAQTRLLGEIFSQIMVREIVTELMDEGVLAVSPDVTPMFNKKRYPNVGWASPWSHRHVAYAAGLGTFGMHDFLITGKGCAHRLGSFVVRLRLEPGRERPDDIHAHCLHHRGIPCLACAARCPVGAISASGHDKEGCSKRVAASLMRCNARYHIFIYGCGLCAAGVPCSTRIPEPS